MAAPSRLTVVIVPRILPRSSSGNQRVITRAVFGKAPASPAPNRNRTITSDHSPSAMPVKAVNADHQMTIRAMMRREPKRSARWPVGTSNRQYARMKAE
jgi:hypothetical protein